MYGAAHRDCESTAESVDALATTETYPRRRERAFRVISLAVAVGALVACGAMINATRGGNVLTLGTVLAAEADDGATGVDPTSPPGSSADTVCLDACGGDVKDRVMELLDMRSCGELDGVDKSCLSTDACESVRTNIKEECPNVL